MRRLSGALEGVLFQNLTQGRPPVCLPAAQCTLEVSCRQQASGRLPPPPPRLGSLRPGGAKMPPPPPLPGRGAAAAATAAGGGAAAPAAIWRSPPEILSLYVEFIPTFFVPTNCVAAIMSEDARALVRGRGRFMSFLKKYRFFFDARLVDGSRVDVKLREDVNHPRKGVADDKFVMTDVGDVTTYTARPEFITSLESLENVGQQSVTLRPHTPPPSVHVRLEERVPVLERLKLMMPKEFVTAEELEEKVPEDILFHPYFDCQGGLLSIANKFPDYFQVVDGRVRLRPPHLAPMALGELAFDDSPMKEVIGRVRRAVCLSDVPQWVSVTSIYEQLTLDEKRAIKRDFKSFAGFLRAHGKSLAVSTDTLSVAFWTPPQRRGGTSSGGADDASGLPAEAKPLIYTHVHILNELFDKFPPGRSLTVSETLALLPADMAPSIPPKFAAFLVSHPGYFHVDFVDEPDRTTIRRASDSLPLDVAYALYPLIPDGGIAVAELLPLLPAGLQRHIGQVGLPNIVTSLSQWLALGGGGDAAVLRRLRTEAELEAALSKSSAADDDDEDGPEAKAVPAPSQVRSMRYEGGMAPPPRQQRPQTGGPPPHMNRPH